MAQKLQKFILPVIIFIGAFFRFIWLGTVPSAVNHDQLYYLINAKSFFLTGKDLSQTVSLWDIFLFMYPPHDLIQVVLPFLLSYLSIGSSPFSVALSALPNVILSILTVLVIYGITKELFNKNVALLSAVIAAINPWFIFSGRTLYEAVPATFFFSLAFYILLVAKNWKILLAVPVLILAFYSYIGTKIIFIPLILVFVGYSYFFVHNKKYLKQYLTLIGLSLIFVFFYVFQTLHAGGASRISEITYPDNPKIIQEVNDSRRLSVPSPLVKIYENKVTVFAAVITKLVVESFSPTYLFLEGDYFFSLGNHGLLYVIDGIFLLLGGVALYKKKRKLLYLFLILILLSVIPQVVHDPTGMGGNFTPHISLIFPFFIVMIAYGVWSSAAHFKGRSLKIFMAIIAAIYLILLGNFAVKYYLQLPYKNGLFDFSSRVLSSYLQRLGDESEIMVYTQQPEETMKNYMFYSNSYNSKSVAQINTAFNSHQYKVGRFTFLPCDKIPKSLVPNQILILQSTCGNKFGDGHLAVPSLYDGGAVYEIYNDKVCGGINIKGWISEMTYELLQVEKLDTYNFCSTYLIHNG